MSLQLLYTLNGDNNGRLKNFLDTFVREPRIAWYPSSQTDFRALLYLHPNFSRLHPANHQEPQPPELFLYTDYFPWQNSTFLDYKEIYADGETRVTVESIEQLPRLNLPLHQEIVDFPEGSTATNRVLFLEIKIESNQLGIFTCPVLYAFVENESFYCHKLIENEAKISHIIHVCYGGGCGGGGKASGGWLLNVLAKLGCEVFISDNRHELQSGDKEFMKICPSVPINCSVELITIKDFRWSQHVGNVSWYLTQNNAIEHGMEGVIIPTNPIRTLTTGALMEYSIEEIIRLINTVGQRVFYNPSPLFPYNLLVKNSLGANTYRGFHKIDKKHPGSKEVFERVLTDMSQFIIESLQSATTEQDVDNLEKEICKNLKTELKRNIDNKQLDSFNKLRKPVDIFIEHIGAMGTDFSLVRPHITKYLFLPLDSQMFKSNFVFSDSEVIKLRIKRTFSFKDITDETHYHEIQDFLKSKAQILGIENRIFFDLVWNERYRSEGNNLFETNPKNTFKKIGPLGDLKLRKAKS